jgi:hypothetical protein
MVNLKPNQTGKTRQKKSQIHKNNLVTIGERPGRDTLAAPCHAGFKTM